MSGELSDSDLDSLFTEALGSVFAQGGTVAGCALKPGPVLILPPDLTRIHSRAGFLTGIACRELARCGRRDLYLGAIMPALGTHRPLTPPEIAYMFPGCPPDKFIPHLWRKDTVELGRIEAEWVESAFGGHGGGRGGHGGGSRRAISMDWRVQVNRLLPSGANGRSCRYGKSCKKYLCGNGRRRSDT